MVMLGALSPALRAMVKRAGKGVMAAVGVDSKQPGDRRPRRRRRGLTAREKNDILFIKEAVGKTAAAQYIALLRGR